MARTTFDSEASRVTLPNNSVVALRSRWDCEYIESTNTSYSRALTGRTTAEALYSGMQIIYRPKYDMEGSGNVTLNLTLKDGTTTGAKNVYYRGSTQLSTQYLYGGSPLHLVYFTELAINGGVLMSGWWVVDPYTDTNTTYTHPTSAGYKHVPSGGATNNYLIYGGSSGTASWATGFGKAGTGTGSVILGDLASYTDVSNSKYDTGNNSSGSYSIAAGQGNTVTSSHSFVSGRGNSCTSSNSAVFGFGNEVSSSYSFAAGYSNKLLSTLGSSCSYNFVLGSNNTTDGPSYSSVLLGQNNTSIGSNPGNILIGSDNLVDSSGYTGSRSYLTAGYNFVIGDHNTILHPKGSTRIPLSHNVLIGTQLNCPLGWHNTILGYGHKFTDPATDNDDEPTRYKYHYLTVVGRYANITKYPGQSSTATSSPTPSNSAGDSGPYLFLVGNGLSSSNRMTALRVSVSGNLGIQGSLYANGGADYAEYFEWSDGNKSFEDRRGRFVTFDQGETIRFATSDDDYVLGVVTSTPCVVGDCCDQFWKDRYVTDIYGKVIDEEITIPEHKDEETGEIVPDGKVLQPMTNPEYDPDREYVSRAQRSEWDPVGLMGKIIVEDDGTCEVNGYAIPGVNGIATKGTRANGYRVMSRLDETHVRILFK